MRRKERVVVDVVFEGQICCNWAERGSCGHRLSTLKKETTQIGPKMHNLVSLKHRLISFKACHMAHLATDTNFPAFPARGKEISKSKFFSPRNSFSWKIGAFVLPDFGPLGLQPTDEVVFLTKEEKRSQTSKCPDNEVKHLGAPKLCHFEGTSAQASAGVSISLSTG